MHHTLDIFPGANLELVPLSGHSQSVYIMKLTDSCSRAIEEYLQNGDCSENPKICFVNKSTAGEFQIPRHNSGHKDFSFTVSTLNDNMSFEAVQQVISGKSSRLKVIGNVDCRITVAANEETYSTTLQKMNMVVVEEKKTCAKEIDTSQVSVARRIVRNSQKPVSSSNTVKQSPINETRTGVSKRPLQERIIHLLAIRPYRKPELLLRLSKEGLKESEKECIETVLTSVALRTKSNLAYTLPSSRLSEVSPQWPFYTEDERKIVADKFKRRETSNDDLLTKSSVPHTPKPTEDNTAIEIKDKAQREKYAEEHRQAYPEYWELFNFIQKESDYFEKLGQELRNETSEEKQQAIMQKIYQRSQDLDEYEDYQAKRAKYERLYKRLNEVKLAIDEWDAKHSKKL